MKSPYQKREEIRQAVLWTTRNKGVDVLCNKLDFVWLLDQSERASRFEAALLRIAADWDDHPGMLAREALGLPEGDRV